MHSNLKADRLSFFSVPCTQAAEAFVRLVTRNYPSFKITYVASFSETPVFGFDQLRLNRIKIILALFSDKIARGVLCQVGNTILLY